ncbi:sporulation protein [Cytobacillus purgationiresistens]|uniref:Sporulation-control protein n=1 Tax=Cytobacillus purgationiresistens TaxID=863449 RepID=A0ABU0ARN8_9BACI|nr:sporulation protein [Cytobacillus purgationiresistens]MDQ0273924.1 sporulation-control protein [Cytobacillus purgationiresistens]
MSLFNKVLASVGIGAAKVDTKLHSETVFPGGEVTGVVEVKGGKIEQKIAEIYINVSTAFEKESDDKKYYVNSQIERIRLSESFLLKSDEEKEIPFSFVLPLDTTVSIGKSKIWISTELDIKNAVDPDDKDVIRVIPNPLMKSAIDAVIDLGFKIREVDCVEVPHGLRRRLPFVQEFEFIPVSGSFRGHLDELEMVFYPNTKNEIDLMIQVDRRARGIRGLFSEALSMDESTILVKIADSDILDIREKIKLTISKYA